MPKPPERFKKKSASTVKLLMPDELMDFKHYVHDIVKNNPNMLKSAITREELNRAVKELRESRKFRDYVYDLVNKNPELFKKSASKSLTQEDIDKVVAELRKSRKVIESFKQEYGDLSGLKRTASVSKVVATGKPAEQIVEDVSVQRPALVKPKKEPKSQVVEKDFSQFELKPHEEKERHGLFSQALSTFKTKAKPKPGSDEAKVALLKEDIRFEIDLFPKIISLPDVEDRTRINIRYPLLPPFAFAHIFWDDKNKELVYMVEEPPLTDKEKELLDLIQVALEEMINIPFTKAQNHNFVSKYLQKNVQAILIELSVKITRSTYQKIMYYVYRDGIGMNEIEPLLKDYYIEDIECNGVGFPLYIVHRKYGNLRTNVIYNDYDKIGDFVEKLAQKTGRYVSYAQPLLDGALPDGSRVNATYTRDITTRGPTFTIRKFTKEPWSPAHMIGFKTATPELFAYLWLAIEHKFNIMVIGETGSGKTSFLNTILMFVPSEARITSVEDTRELNLMHDNWLPAVQRMGFGIPNVIGQKYGEVTMFDLLKESFRQNPDYMVVGEVRGPEAYVLFQGMASGHPSYGTFHANDVATMIRRFETAPINLSASLVESMDIVVVTHHIKTAEKSIRRVREVQEIIEVMGKVGEARTNMPFEWDAVSDKINYLDKSVIFEKITKRVGIPKQELEKEFQRRSKLLAILEKKKIVEFRDFKKVINTYYKDKKGVLAKFGIKV
jgi:flagellar protein FlaI